MVENKLRLEKFIDELFGFVNDLILVQVANGGAEEVRKWRGYYPSEVQ